MSHSWIGCPQCLTVFLVPATESTDVAYRCAECNATFRVPANSAPEAPTPARQSARSNKKGLVVGLALAFAILAAGNVFFVVKHLTTAPQQPADSSPAAVADAGPTPSGTGKQPPKISPEVEAALGTLDLSTGLQPDGYLSTQGRIMTKESYTGPIEITAVASTERYNIRLYAYRGAVVIFNWEVNDRELRVHRPDGKLLGNGSAARYTLGSVATAPVEPLTTNQWHTLRWLLTADGCEVWVDGQPVFVEKRKYDLSSRQQLGIGSIGSNISVKSFHVKSLGSAQPPGN